MSYINPILHKCPRCEYEVYWGPQDPVSYALYDEEGKPFCPKCLAKFLRGEAGDVPLLANTGKYRPMQ